MSALHFLNIVVFNSEFVAKIHATPVSRLIEYFMYFYKGFEFFSLATRVFNLVYRLDVIVGLYLYSHYYSLNLLIYSFLFFISFWNFSN